MSNKGLSKAIEELAEVQMVLNQLTQTMAKKLACMDTDEHWDGAGPLSIRLEEEIGDAQAGLHFLAKKLELDSERIVKRRANKLNLFLTWDKEEDAKDKFELCPIDFDILFCAFRSSTGTVPYPVSIEEQLAIRRLMDIGLLYCAKVASSYALTIQGEVYVKELLSLKPTKADHVQTVQSS